MKVMLMVSSVLSVPLSPEMSAEMKKHPETKWVEVARQAILQRLVVLEKMDVLLANSTFTQEDALKHGRLINKKVWARHKKLV